MKSQLKVDYKSRYGDGLGDKEPIVRIDVVPSDDPRDTLLGEIFQDEGFQRIGGSQINPSKGERQFVIFRRSQRERWINDFASPIFLALVRYTGINACMITGSEGIWFELSDNYSVKSEVITNKQITNLEYDYHTEHDRDNKFVEIVVNTWKDFEKRVEETRSK